LIGWPAASASRCVQVRGTIWTRSYPPTPVSSQRPPARSWASAWIAAERRAARRCSAPGGPADLAGACRPVLADQDLRPEPGQQRRDDRVGGAQPGSIAGPGGQRDVDC
jgi:hypothetical protein